MNEDWSLEDDESYSLPDDFSESNDESDDFNPIMEEYLKGIEEDDSDWDDDLKVFNKTIKSVKKYIEKNKITVENYSKKKKALIRNLKKDIKELDLLLLTEAYFKRETFSGFIRKHENLRRDVFKALMARMDGDAKIIITQDLLRELIGDDEPAELYIH